MAASTSEKKTVGLIAHFKEAQPLHDAAEQVRDAGYTVWDVYAPLPIHGMDAAMGLKRSKVPRFTLLGGCCGLVFGYIMVWFMNYYDYPLIVGGKPFFSPVFPFPVVYEATILLAAFGTFFGMFISNRLPRHHHPLFDYEPFKKASDDEFFIFIDARDPLFDLTKSKKLLKDAGGDQLSLIEE